ncbi:hypothetical protein JCM8097_001473 [Rhodosporidiobolus ruineniae]
MSTQDNAGKPKAQRATTSSKNRAASPPPYRSQAETTIEDFITEFWQHALNVAEHHEDDFKHQSLPLARIKKVAKMDPEVQNQMISSEVTVLFEKACQIFIQELTARAHLVSLAARRRTLSRADVASAVSRSDMFDFLIDIVPRAERTAASSAPSTSNAGASTSSSRAGKRPQRRTSQRDDDIDEADFGVGAAAGLALQAGGAEDDDEEEEDDEGAEPPTLHPLMQPQPPQASGSGSHSHSHSHSHAHSRSAEEEDEDEDEEPAAKRFRPDVGGSNGAAVAGAGGATPDAATQAAMAGYYGLHGAAAGGSGVGAGQAFAQQGLGSWPGGFEYTDPALAAFYAHQQQQAQQQAQQNGQNGASQAE